MARYYFYLQGTRPYLDEDGIELADDGSAWQQAKRFVRDIEGEFEPGEQWRLEVLRDGRPIFLLIVNSSKLD
jgi:uncharacterized protein DUF6894